MPGAAGALCAYIFCRCARSRAVLDVVRAGLALVKLPIDHAVQQIRARIEAEDLVR
jgi:hypothetical protein